MDLSKRNPQFAQVNTSGGSSDGTSWCGTFLETDWEKEPIFLGGGGSNGEGRIPDCFAVNLYLNRNLAAELTLLPVEGDAYGD